MCICVLTCPWVYRNFVQSPTRTDCHRLSLRDSRTCSIAITRAHCQLDGFTKSASHYREYCQIISSMIYRPKTIVRPHEYWTVYYTTPAGQNIVLNFFFRSSVVCSSSRFTTDPRSRAVIWSIPIAMYNGIPPNFLDHAQSDTANG